MWRGEERERERRGGYRERELQRQVQSYVIYI